MKANRLLLMVPIIFSCIGCDRISKSVAQEHLAGTPVQSYMWDIFRLHYAENPGAFLGIGANMPESARFWIFVIVVGLILVGLLVWTICSRSLSLIGVAALSLLLGGGISNLYDRVFNNGIVVDFLNLGLGDLRTGIFNVADVSISTGVAMLITGEIARTRKRRESEKN